ncbi:MAG: TolC family protein [Cyclobacteriaceae bacterium]|nr:TolC family protein [Cyclobacteriaceae bacterium]
MQKPTVILAVLLVVFSFELKAQAHTAQTPTLRLLIENALQQDHELSKLRLEQDGTEVKKKLVRSTFIPTIHANAIYGYGQFGLTDFHLNIPISSKIQSLGGALAPVLGLAQNPVPPELTTDLSLKYNDLQVFTAGINAQWVLFTGMRASYTQRALAHTSNAQQEMIDKHASAVVAEVVEYYDKLSLTRQSEMVISNSRKRLSKEKERVDKALAQGLITIYDQQKIEIAALELDSRALEIENNKRLIIYKLKQLCGLSEEELLSMNAVVAPLGNGPVAYTDDERPEMRALHEKHLAMENKLKSANAGYLPQIAAMANYQYADLDVMKVDPLAFVGLGAKWELFDGLKTSREKQLIKLEMLREQTEQARIRELLQLDMELKRSTAAQAEAQIALQEKIVEKAGLALEIKSKEYARGLCDISAWLAADNDFQKAQLNYQKSIFDQRHAAMELLKVRGDLQTTYTLLFE